MGRITLYIMLYHARHAHVHNSTGGLLDAPRPIGYPNATVRKASKYHPNTTS